MHQEKREIPAQVTEEVNRDIAEGVSPNIVELAKAIGLNINRLKYVRWLIKNEKISDNYKSVMEQLPLPGFQ